MHYLPLDDTTHIYYKLIDGPKNKPYLIFLHEGLGCTEMWKDFPYKICQLVGCPGLIYDRKGYGKSSPLYTTRSNKYLHEAAFSELRDVIEKIIPEAPHIIIGHSDGGSIALIYASLPNPGLLGIITEAAHVFVEDVTITGIREADKHFEVHGSKGLEKYHGSQTYTIFKAWSETWLSRGFKTWNIENLLKDIRCPSLILQGANDRYGTIRQVESIVSNIPEPAESHIIANCGHAPHFEAQPEVTGLMVNFIIRLTK